MSTTSNTDSIPGRPVLTVIDGGRDGVDGRMVHRIAGIRAAAAEDPAELERYLVEHNQVLQRRSELKPAGLLDGAGKRLP